MLRIPLAFFWNLMLHAQSALVRETSLRQACGQAVHGVLIYVADSSHNTGLFMLDVCPSKRLLVRQGLSFFPFLSTEVEVTSALTWAMRAGMWPCRSR